MNFTWTFGVEGGGLYFIISYDGTDWSLEMKEGSMDLNALWFSDGDTAKEGNTSLSKKNSSLSMDGSGSHDPDGNLIVWDDVKILSSSGLGKAGFTKNTYLRKDESINLNSHITYSGNPEDLILGVRSTSVNGTGSIKLVATAESIGPTTGHLFVLAQGGLDAVLGGKDEVRDTYWLDDGDGIFDPTKDTNVTNATDNIADGADYANREWTVEFLGIPGADKIDLTGFGIDDHIVINANAMNTVLKMWGDLNPIVPTGSGTRTVNTGGGGYIANRRSSDLGYTSTIAFNPGQILQSGFNKAMPFGATFFNTYSGPIAGGYRNSVSMNAYASSTPTFTNVNAAAYLGWPLTITNELGEVPISFMAERMAFTVKGTSLKFFDSNRAAWAKQFTVITTPFPTYPSFKNNKKYFASYSNNTSMSLKLASGLNSATLPSLQVIWPDLA